MYRPQVAFISALLSSAVMAASAQPLRPIVTLVRAQGTSPREARAALVSRVEPIARCVSNARSTDPALLLRMRFFNAIVLLANDGRATSVELSPPLTTRGFSACVAEALLDWSQRGPVSPQGSVTLRVLLPAP